MTAEPPPSSPSPVARFFGGALIAVGIMMMLLCGGCGVLFLGYFLFETMRASNPEDISFILMPIFLGGVPAGIGLGLFIAGRALRRPPG
jgi:hypothetical protein